MSNWFPEPNIAGEAGHALEEALNQVIANTPSNILAPQPDTHPGLLALVAFAPHRGTIAPKLAPRGVAAPAVASGLARGLLWGVATTLVGEWADGQLARVMNDTDVSGFAYPANATEQMGRIVMRCAEAVAQVSPETLPRLQPQIIPRPPRPVVVPEDEDDPDKQRRWRVFARSKAGRRVH